VTNLWGGKDAKSGQGTLDLFTDSPRTGWRGMFEG
jgi:hypothetical protein